MRWLDRLQRRFGKYAIKNLMIYIVSANLLVFLLSMFDTTGQITEKLTLYPELVMRGEVWRLISYIFLPPSSSIIFILFTLYLYYLIGSSLEQEWGSFRFNIYYLIGVIATSAAAMVVGGPATAVYLNTSLFLAFARLYPDFQLVLFFILPVKIKYLAWLNWGFIALTVILPFFPLSYKVLSVVSVLNYLLFFGKDIISRSKARGKSVYRKQSFNLKANLPRDFTIHRCHICGMTEKDDPRMDFRYCMRCEGDYEYCSNHLNTHEHVKKLPPS